MKERRSILIMMSIMITACLATAAIVILVLYQAELAERQARLKAFVVLQARLIEAVARYDISTTESLREDNPDFDSAAATLSQIKNALGNYGGFGETGELTLARREGEAIVFLLRARGGNVEQPESIDFESGQADSMRQALTGKSGTAFGRNSRGEKVIAAFEPVGILDLGLVGTIDLTEIRSDFVPATRFAFFSALLLAAFSTLIFRRVSDPVVEKLSRHARVLEAQLELQAKADAELKKWELVFRYAGWGVAITDASSNEFLAVNPAFAGMHGYDFEEVQKMNIADICSEKDRALLPARTKQVTANGGLLYEATHVRKDGSRFPVLVDVRAIRNEQGNILFHAENFQDISEQKTNEEVRRNLERQILHAQKLESLGLLAGGIAHDFNNLLMTILGNADIAQQDLAPHAPARSSIEIIIDTARRAADLSKQMLAYSGRGLFVIEPIDLNSFVQEMSHLLDVSISKKAVLKYNFADHLPGVEGDATQIRQIIMNLIINSSEAIGDRSGVISLTTGAQDCDHEYLNAPNNLFLAGLNEPLPEGLYVYLEVADTGSGMNVETREKIFDPFFTTKFTGRGLGMAAVLGIVRGHHGLIHVYSEIGRGTTIKVLFPAMDRQVEDAIETVTEETTAEWRGEGLVLIADDEETVRALTKRYLQRMGFEAITAADGKEAIDLFREHSQEIVCVLLDMTMPHVDGKEAFREIRKIRQDAKVLLCSGYNEQDATQHFVGKGLAGFIPKPYREAELKEKLKKVLA